MRGLRISIRIQSVSTIFNQKVIYLIYRVIKVKAKSIIV